MKKISVVIGFRDWGLDRLLTNVRLHLAHCVDHDIEVIVSDYGSNNSDMIRAAVKQVGGIVVRTESSHLNWNRSAALNAGIAVASGDVIITTDADIFFSPESYRAVVEKTTANPDALYLIQCRDLPKSLDVDAVNKIIRDHGRIDFSQVHDVSTLRPRWGMGGMAAFTRAAFDRLNGYEERMELWGKEDTDFAKRFHLNRMPRRWISQRDVGIYHIWHESSQKKANETDEGRALLAENQRILDHDHTPMRNRHKVFGSTVPPVSIIIPTYNRAKFLRSCLESVKRQSFSNFEVIVVENGGTREAEPIVGSMRDHRFRYLFTPKKGAAAARNIGIDNAVGRYVVIMDDDDLMVSTRVEDHLSAINGGTAHGSYGGWIDFDDESGEIIALNPGKQHSMAAMFATGKVIVHAGLMVEKNIFQVFRYDETRNAGIDYALLLRLTFLGLQLTHTGRFALLRRMHGSNMTSTLSAEQKESAVHGISELKAAISEAAQDDLRRRGRNTPFLECSNKASALLELRNARRVEAEIASLIASGALSPRFDAEQYVARYPDVTLSGMDPLHHYIRYGLILGRTM
ncbi:glycosyltransferase family 2 protein [Paracoccus niistensis]|uniref:Glycosyltransferase family 2 protein n=1 Tax=Paracoccus niistensis TaxID=632935 RepID=A0ABV6I8I0_9RHOB